MRKTLIIAEAGVNHNGSLKMAEELANEAKEAGADIVKFQTFNPNAITSKYAHGRQRKDEHDHRYQDRQQLCRKRQG